jgi:AraC-like DNA-binding protein
MAKQVQSWEAEDGTLHKTECAAATRDVEMLVERSPLAENSPYAKKLTEWLCKHASEIRTKLEAHERACPKVKAEPAATEPEPTIALKERISAAIGQMQERGRPAQEWLMRNGFQNLSHFTNKATEGDVEAWERFADEPAAFEDTPEDVRAEMIHHGC